MMKKYILTLVALLATMSINAQLIKVYKNGGSEPVATFTNSATDKYQVVLKKYDPNLLPGRFSVAPKKKVKFTKGNLYWDGNAFRLEKKQTDILFHVDYSHVCHFFWAKNAANAYVDWYEDETINVDDAPFFAESRGGLTVEGSSGLFVLTKDEWEYLLWKRDNAASLTKYNVSVSQNGNMDETCLVIAPDDYDYTANPLKSSYTLDETESTGLVFLPITCQRIDNEHIEGALGGYYWTSTFNNKEDKAYCLLFDNENTFTLSLIDSCFGHALRLVSLD